MISFRFLQRGSLTATLLLAATPDAFALSAAHINADGTISAGSTGLSPLSTHPGIGIYCLLPSSTTVQQKQAQGKLFPQLTLDYLHSIGNNVSVALGNTAAPNFMGACPSTSYIEVLTYRPDSVTNAAFTIAF